MKRYLFFITPLMIALFFISCDSDESTDETPVYNQYDGYTLIWNDEFDSIDPLHWTYEIGDGTDYGLNPGWGNQEEQLYTDSAENSYIEVDENNTSALVIAATKDSEGQYYSAKLTTQALQSFRFGRIEARIKLPTAQGMWPAFWMLGDNIDQVGWSGCGEIDIVELVGKEPNVVHGTVHYTSSENSHKLNGQERSLLSGIFSDDYHNFRIDWTPETIVFSLDEVSYHTIQIQEDMKEFKRSFYLILNLAVGGSWPGSPNQTTIFPQKMYIDYIRAYSLDGFNPPIAPELDIDEETIGVIVDASTAQLAFNSTLNQFPGIGMKSFGAGGEPDIIETDQAVEGEAALLFRYPGGSWGGSWFETESDPYDLSTYSSGHLVFSLAEPEILHNVEIKLEAVSNEKSLFLINYTPEPLGNGYVEYTIPMADFGDLDLSAIKIPFSLWNPKDAGGSYPALDIYVDNIYFRVD